MSEPRKINVGGASNADHSSIGEFGSRIPSAASNQRRSIQTGGARRKISVPDRPAAVPVQQQEVKNDVKPAKTFLPEEITEDTLRGLTIPQRQALALRQSVERRNAEIAEEARRQRQAPQVQQPAQNVPRAGKPSASVSNRSARQSQQEQQALRERMERRQQQNASVMAGGVQELDLHRTAPKRVLYDYDSDTSFESPVSSTQNAPRTQRSSAQIRRPQQKRPAAGTVAQAGIAAASSRHAVHSPEAEADMRHSADVSGERTGKGGRKKSSPNRKGNKTQKQPKDGAAKAKKGLRWWQILLITLLVLALIFGGTIFFILHAISPKSGGITLSQMLNTPQEFKDDEFNFVVVGIDRSSQADLSAGGDYDPDVNDGNTDMILYVHFNNVTGELKMLQIPRDTFVTTDPGVSGNYRINNVAKTQAVTSNSMNIPALCELISDMYQVPIDGYMMIRLEMLVELVDLFNGIEMNIPFEMDYGGSYRPAGYQRLDGAAVEFVLRTRHIYPDGDIGRLNMQRQFYSALFRKLKSIGNIWDVAKLAPAVINYLETDISASKLISLAISMLKINSNKIMICQMPVIAGGSELYYNGQAVVWPARQDDADLLNTYFRENTGAVDASQLNLLDNIINLNGYSATSPNVQVMGSIMEADAQAQQNNNLDGSYEVEYTVEEAPQEETTDSPQETAPAA